MRIIIWFGIIVTGVILGACGGGGSGGFDQAVASASSPLADLDLVTGKITYATDIADLQTNPMYRKEHLVFRRIRGGASMLGAPDTESYAEVDEFKRYGRKSLGETLVAVFELTQAQYTLLAGPTSNPAPWTLFPIPGSGPDKDAKPAFGLSASLVKSRLNAYAARTGVRMRLPSADEWEYCSRAGSTALFSWGSQIEGTQPESQAVVRRTATPALASVGSLAPNAFGLFDMHGNVWELTSDVRSDDVDQEVICGGSWYQSSLQARCSNRSSVHFSINHPLVGVRLILSP